MTQNIPYTINSGEIVYNTLVYPLSFSSNGSISANLNICRDIFLDIQPYYDPDTYGVTCGYKLLMVGGTSLQSRTFFSPLDKNHLGIACVVYEGACTAEIPINYTYQDLGNFFCQPQNFAGGYGVIPALGDGVTVTDIFGIPRLNEFYNHKPGERLYLQLLGYNPDDTPPTLRVQYEAYVKSFDEADYLYIPI